jgi:hypothetical protein
MGRHFGHGSALVLLSLIALDSGCVSQSLRLATRRNANTLPDLHYQQVTDNLAAIASNSNFLPYLAVAGAGTVQVTENRNSSLGLSFAPKHYSTEILNIGASQAVTGTWSLGTITNPEKLRSMRALYQEAVRGSVQHDPAWAWLKIGRRTEVARDACYVGRHGDVFAWITPDGIGGLSELTLAIMDIGTREDSTVVPATSKGAASPGAAPHTVPRRNFQIHPLGPVYTPGVR